MLSIFSLLGKRENITAVGIIVAIGGISFVLALLAGDFVRYKNLNEARNRRHSAYEDELRRLSGLTTNLTPAPDPTADWKTYQNGKYQIFLKYPQNWQAPQESYGQKGSNYLQKISFDEKGFVSEESGKGFDVYIYSAAKFSGPEKTDELTRKENAPTENCPHFDDITLGEKGYPAKEINIGSENPCYEKTFFYSLAKDGYIFNIVPRQSAVKNVFEDGKKINLLRAFPEFYDMVSTLDLAEKTNIGQLTRKVSQRVTEPPRVRYTSGASCAHKKDNPRKSKTKGKHMDEDCCPDPDEWPNPRCAYSGGGLALMRSGP